MGSGTERKDRAYNDALHFFRDGHPTVFHNPRTNTTAVVSPTIVHPTVGPGDSPVLACIHCTCTFRRGRFDVACMASSLLS
jgi:hypothetical protein